MSVSADILTKNFPTYDFKINFNLSEYSTYKTGGNSEIAFFPKNSEQIANFISFAYEQNIKITVLGGGSNVLISDKGISGVTIMLSHLDNVCVTGNEIRVFCGAAANKISEAAYKYSLKGAEFLAGLPGSIGGAAFMNARAFGSEMSEILKSAVVIDQYGKLSEYQSDPKDFEYKKSPFRSNKWIITELVLSLSVGKKEEIYKKIQHNINHRRQNGEDLHPSCGCVFKNPYHAGISAGKLIDQAGLKRFGTKHARVYEKHANFIVHDGLATSSEIRKLMDQVKQKIFFDKNINLEYEVEFLGDWEDWSSED